MSTDDENQMLKREITRLTDENASLRKRIVDLERKKCIDETIQSEHIDETIKELRESRDERLVNGFTYVVEFFKEHVLGDICDPKLSNNIIDNLINGIIVENNDLFNIENTLNKFNLTIKDINDYKEINSNIIFFAPIYRYNDNYTKIYQKILLYQTKLLNSKRRNVLLDDRNLTLITVVLDWLKSNM